MSFLRYVSFGALLLLLLYISIMHSTEVPSASEGRPADGGAQPVAAPFAQLHLPQNPEGRLSLMVNSNEIWGALLFDQDTLMIDHGEGDEPFRMAAAELAKGRAFLQDFPSHQSVQQLLKKQFYERAAIHLPIAPTETPTGHPLAGKKIAIDPGHLGGDMEMALLEGKFVRMRHGDELLEFNEGNLNLATAILLKQKLEAVGAEVLLTRSAEGVSAFGKTYGQWLEQDFEKALQTALKQGEINRWEYRKLKRYSPQQVFHRFFKHREMKERARKINRFAPDISLVIHFNIDERTFLSRPNKSEMVPAEVNYCMAFIPGSFLDGELQKPEDRIAFAQKLFSEDVERSILLAERVMHYHHKLLKVPFATAEHRLSYLEHNSLPIPNAPGVYARNLVLTRFINGPVCYGESFCQDSRTEFLQLYTPEGTAEAAMQLPRLQQTAEAYYLGVLDYFEQLPRIFN